MPCCFAKRVSYEGQSDLCPNEIAEAILGHVQPGIVGVYNRHHYDAERLLWLTRLSERLEGLE